jgi:hypothetical protein
VAIQNIATRAKVPITREEAPRLLFLPTREKLPLFLFAVLGLEVALCVSELV